jgi:phosphatidylinositol glycan class B
MHDAAQRSLVSDRSVVHLLSLGTAMNEATIKSDAASVPSGARDGTRDRRSAVIAGAAVFVAAFLLRLIPVLIFPGINYPDEIIQTTEQAHRLVYGVGMVPWEFIYGTRSWIIPGFIAGVMRFAALFGDGPLVYLPIIGGVLAALSAVSALCAFLWGRRFYGIAGGVAAGLLTACWMDAVYFGPRALSEVIAAHLMIIGFYLSLLPETQRGWHRAFWGGLLLALAALLRIHLAPAIGLVFLWAAATKMRPRLVAFVGGAAAAVLFYGAVDAATWSYPFESLWRNVSLNLMYGVEESFGVTPWYDYAVQIVGMWGGLAAIMLALSLIGAVRLPALFLAAAVILLTHSLIGHKEYRFIYPAILIGVILAGIGLARIVTLIGDALMRERLSRPLARGSVVAAAIAIVAAAQIAMSRAPDAQELWSRGAAGLRAAHYVSALQTLCGIGVYLSAMHQYGGYTNFHRAVPLYILRSDADLAAMAPGFDTIVYELPEKPAGDYTLRACFGRTCVAQRAGACAPIPMPPRWMPPHFPASVKPERAP